MITKEDIKYELEYLENIVPDIIEKAHTDEIIVWVTGSGCNPSNTYGRYRMIMQYNSTKKYFEGNEEGATANQAYLYGIINAVEKISKPSRICAVVPLSLGFETAFKGKGTNVKIINRLYELIKEKGCTFTEVRCDNGADVIKRFISVSSGKSELVREEVEKTKRVQGYKDAYKKKLYDECIEKVVDVLIANHIDEDVINQVKQIGIE